MRLLAAVSFLFFELILCTWGVVISDLTEDYKKEEIIPDVLDKAPTNLLMVTYNGKDLQFGAELTPTEVKDAPSIGWGLDSTGFYTLIMNGRDPEKHEGILWIVTNIPGDDFIKGETIYEYLGSGPPKDTGVHRYTFVVYKQPGKMTFNEKHVDRYVMEGRLNVTLRGFAERYNLGDPVAGNMFRSQYDDYVPELYKKLDPDAPTRQDPKMREYLHWAVVNIPGDDFSKGETLAEYMGAGPPLDTGLHRYILMVYHQPGKLSFDEKPMNDLSIEGRVGFNMRNFIEKYKLDKHVVGNMFQAQYDDYVPLFYKKMGM